MTDCEILMNILDGRLVTTIKKITIKIVINHIEIYIEAIMDK